MIGWINSNSGSIHSIELIKLRKKKKTEEYLVQNENNRKQMKLCYLLWQCWLNENTHILVIPFNRTDCNVKLVVCFWMQRRKDSLLKWTTFSIGVNDSIHVVVLIMMMITNDLFEWLTLCPNKQIKDLRNKRARSSVSVSPVIFLCVCVKWVCVWPEYPCKVIGIGGEWMHIYFLYIYVYAYIATQIFIDFFFF